jgi:hypothetical protein
MAAPPSSGVPPHPEDPIQENPAPIGSRKHAVWEEATREAEQKLFELKATMSKNWLPGRYTQETLQYWIGRFRIWADRDLCLRTNDQGARDHEQWLQANKQALLKQATEGPFSAVEVIAFANQLEEAVNEEAARGLEQVAAIKAHVWKFKGLVEDIPCIVHNQNDVDAYAKELRSCRRDLLKADGTTSRQFLRALQLVLLELSEDLIDKARAAVEAGANADATTELTSGGGVGLDATAGAQPKAPKRQRRSDDPEYSAWLEQVKGVVATCKSHKEACKQLDMRGLPPPLRCKWRTLRSWAKAYKDSRYKNTVSKWLSKYCKLLPRDYRVDNKSTR